MQQNCDLGLVVSNMAACSDVLLATMTMLRGAHKQSAAGNSDVNFISAANTSVNLAALSSCTAPGEAVCHHCALDPKEGMWTLASSREGNDCVLMVMKGTLSKSSLQFLERVCLYRMRLPVDFAAMVGDEMASQTLPPRVSSVTMDKAERLKNMKVCLRLRAVLAVLTQPPICS